MFLLSYAAVFLCGTVTGFFALANLAMVVMVRQERAGPREPINREGNP